MTGPLVAVYVGDYTETLAVTISRSDLDQGWMLLPAGLVERFEAARETFQAVEAEVSKYVEANGLELTYDEPPKGT